LNKTYRTREGQRIEALRGLDFEVADGELVAIVGPSGCGKTTLLKILAGLVERSKGTITLRDQPVDGPRRDIGMVFQAPVLLPWRTVFENVMVPAEVQGLERSTYAARARDLLRMVGLEGFERKYPGELSGGMQQRAAICRALVHDPAILLMDEPFGALDAMTREYMNQELLRIWAESGKTIVLITHSIPEAVFLADRVIVLTARPGQIAEVFDVDLPRPRGLEVMSTERFGRYTASVRNHFQAHGALD
jgi:NitT/TauT family transport system ATP-binding protein